MKYNNKCFIVVIYAGKFKQCKSKTIPLQACTGPEVCRRLRPPDYKTIGT